MKTISTMPLSDCHHKMCCSAGDLNWTLLAPHSGNLTSVAPESSHAFSNENDNRITTVTGPPSFIARVSKKKSDSSTNSSSHDFLTLFALPLVSTGSGGSEATHSSSTVIVKEIMIKVTESESLPTSLTLGLANLENMEISNFWKSLDSAEILSQRADVRALHSAVTEFESSKLTQENCSTSENNKLESESESLLKTLFDESDFNTTNILGHLNDNLDGNDPLSKLSLNLSQTDSVCRTVTCNTTSREEPDCLTSLLNSISGSSTSPINSNDISANSIHNLKLNLPLPVGPQNFNLRNSFSGPQRTAPSFLAGPPVMYPHASENPYTGKTHKRLRNYVIDQEMEEVQQQFDEIEASREESNSCCVVEESPREALRASSSGAEGRSESITKTSGVTVGDIKLKFHNDGADRNSNTVTETVPQRTGSVVITMEDNNNIFQGPTSTESERNSMRENRVLDERESVNELELDTKCDSEPCLKLVLESTDKVKSESVAAVTVADSEEKKEEQTEEKENLTNRNNPFTTESDDSGNNTTVVESKAENCESTTTSSPELDTILSGSISKVSSNSDSTTSSDLLTPKNHTNNSEPVAGPSPVTTIDNYNSSLSTTGTPVENLLRMGTLTPAKTPDNDHVVVVTIEQKMIFLEISIMNLYQLSPGVDIACSVFRNEDGYEIVDVSKPVWHLTTPFKSDQTPFFGDYFGRVINTSSHGNGFVHCAALKKRYGSDAFVHLKVMRLCDIRLGDVLSFRVHINQSETPQVSAPVWRKCTPGGRMSLFSTGPGTNGLKCTTNSNIVSNPVLFNVNDPGMKQFFALNSGLNHVGVPKAGGTEVSNSAAAGNRNFDNSFGTSLSNRNILKFQSMSNTIQNKPKNLSKASTGPKVLSKPPPVVNPIPARKLTNKTTLVLESNKLKSESSDTNTNSSTVTGTGSVNYNSKTQESLDSMIESLLSSVLAAAPLTNSLEEGSQSTTAIRSSSDGSNSESTAAPARVSPIPPPLTEKSLLNPAGLNNLNWTLAGALPGSPEAKDPSVIGEFEGYIKNINLRGHGFIKCQEWQGLHGDVFVHNKVMRRCRLRCADRLRFNVHMNGMGTPQCSAPVWVLDGGESSKTRGGLTSESSDSNSNNWGPMIMPDMLAMNSIGNIMPMGGLTPGPESMTSSLSSSLNSLLTGNCNTINSSSSNWVNNSSNMPNPNFFGNCDFWPDVKRRRMN